MIGKGLERVERDWWFNKFVPTAVGQEVVNGRDPATIRFSQAQDFGLAEFLRWLQSQEPRGPDDQKLKEKMQQIEKKLARKAVGKVKKGKWDASQNADFGTDQLVVMDEAARRAQEEKEMRQRNADREAMEKQRRDAEDAAKEKRDL